MISLTRPSLALLLVLLPSVASTQEPETWPNRTVRLVTPVPPGGSPDVVARIFGERLSKQWKTAVVVENRPGADGVIALRAAIDPKDSHTLLATPSGVLTVTPVIRKMSFDVDVLHPLSIAAIDFLAVVVPSASPFGTLSDLVASAKRAPGAINWFASTGAPAMAFQDFLAKNAIQMVYVSYKGGPEALRDLSEDRIQVSLVPVAAALPLIRAGKLRAIAITNPERAPILPQVPTVQEAGHAELAIEGVLGFLGPPSLNPSARSMISTAIAKIAADPEVKQSLGKMGQIARSSSQEEYRRYLTSQKTYWSEIARRLNIKPLD